MFASLPSLRPLFTTLIAGSAAVACARAEAALPELRDVPTVSAATSEVVVRAVPKTLTVTGTLVANRESEVAADVPGRVVDTKIERGAFVAQGAVLARLDARAATLSRSEAAAQVAAARVQKENAGSECARAERLFAARAISRAELDRERAACQSSDHSTSAAVARQQLAEKSLGDSVIRAPFAGMIAERDVSLGEYVTVGQRIATVVELDPLRLELTIPELAATSVSLGSSVEFELRAFPSERFTAVVRYIGPVLRRATRDLVVEAVVENGAGRLRPGMFAEARLVTGEQRLPVVPKSAVTGEAPNRRVMVLNQGQVEERVVLTGAAQGDAIAVLKGVRAGERVVTSPTPQVRDGVRIR